MIKDISNFKYHRPRIGGGICKLKKYTLEEAKMLYDKKSIYLVMVTPKNNHNKFYRMVPNIPDSTHFTAEYGRVGSTGLKKVYPISSLDKIYIEKINKGYVDQSNLHEEIIYEFDSEYMPIKEPTVNALVDLLRTYANDTIKKSYSINSKNVTRVMIETAQQKLNQMYSISSLNQFNDTLLELFSIIPRKMHNVEEHLAKSVSDFSRILSDEEALLDTMSGQVTQNSRHKKTAASFKKTIIEENGLEIRPCTLSEIDQIKKFLGEESQEKLKQAFYVKNIETEANFNQYCVKHGISRHDVKFLYHGSRNQNWWNILIQGLLLKPNAKIIRSGSMFGNGLYFAPRAQKSIGYTSLNGSYWAKGSSHTGFLAVYKVAYKNPLNVYSWNSSYSTYNKTDMKSFGTDALFASKDHGMLKNDELIIYDEHQATIRYLIELSA